MEINPFYDAYETSLSKLDEHHWQIISNRWARGIDWNVKKLGKRHWTPLTIDGPLFRTKKAAGEYVDNLILAESRWRAHQRWEAEHGGI